ncbi:hypothetical protein ACFL1S_01405 [Pseudomonadota bacterium]
MTTVSRRYSGPASRSPEGVLQSMENRRLAVKRRRPSKAARDTRGRWMISTGASAGSVIRTAEDGGVATAGSTM